MIIRSEKKGNYTILPNALLLDETISDKARGLLVRLLSRPDNWELNVNYLVKTGKTGQTSVRSALKELEAAGYIRKEVSRHANGRIVGVKYIVLDHLVDVNKMVEVPDDVAAVDHFADVGKMVADQKTPINEIHIKETKNKETAPITNTDNKQILKETTTSPPHEPVPVTCAKSMPSSSCSNLEILNLIPERHRSPMVVTFVNKAVSDYPESELKNAVAYAAGNVRGGSMQFRAYLDKTLKNKWADNFEPDTAKHNQIDKESTRKLFMSLPDETLKFMPGNLWAMEELQRREWNRKSC